VTLKFTDTILACFGFECLIGTAGNICTLKRYFLRPSRFVPPGLVRPFAGSGAATQKGDLASEVSRSLNTAGKHCST